MPYAPLKIAGFETGLVQDREDYILPNDAFPTLFNAYVWRERILRKQGSQSLGRLRRILTAQSIGGGTQASPWSFNLFTILSVVGSISQELEIGSLVFTLNGGTTVLNDQGDGTLTASVGVGSGTINYITGDITIIHSEGVAATADVDFNYFPGFPVMGIKLREQNDINNEEYIAFDTVFAYKLTGTTWSELVPGTVWSASDSDFFWSTNFWVNASNQKLFWATNFVNSASNPMRYYDGTSWTLFEPLITTTIKLVQARIVLPFRGRLIALNTFEGTAIGGTATAFRQRIRWAAIGSPIQADAWREDIRGKGAYLDIPTSQSIISAGFVRDNLVIYCERSTWQLRYTGNVIQPFQIEKVNTELGVESTFSSVQFDTSLVGIGDKGIVECDSFKSERIDQKIPDLAYSIQNTNNGVKRVSGYREFKKRLAYWPYPDGFTLESGQYFPNRRLVFNYENGAWALFRDSITAIGTAQISTDKSWASEGDTPWEEANYPWFEKVVDQPEAIGGNQRGFIFFLDAQTVNDAALSINAITGNTTTATVITCNDHGLENGEIIEITGILDSSTFAASLNDKKFSIQYIDKDSFQLYKFSTETLDFTDPQTDAPSSSYIGGGKIALLDNFQIISKRFNFLDQGKRIQIGYIDFLMAKTDSGAITLQMRENYNPITLNELTGDPFFNTTISTIPLDEADGAQKTMSRVYCSVRSSFLTIVLTFSAEQMNGDEVSQDVQIDGIIIWQRPAGKDLYTGEIR